jgi:hypothetical protein
MTRASTPCLQLVLAMPCPQLGVAMGVLGVDSTLANSLGHGRAATVPWRRAAALPPRQLPVPRVQYRTSREGTEAPPRVPSGRQTKVWRDLGRRGG